MLVSFLVPTGALSAGLEYFGEKPSLRYGSAAVFGASGYAGMQMVLALVRSYGAFATVAVTSFRKALTITVSFLIFDKPFTLQYVWSGLLVLLGVYLSAAAKRFRDADDAIAAVRSTLDFFRKIFRRENPWEESPSKGRAEV